MPSSARFDSIVIGAGFSGLYARHRLRQLGIPPDSREGRKRRRDATKTDVGSMEIFRVVDGRITEVWNCGYKQGVWQ
jgi:hypothetical protein